MANFSALLRELAAGASPWKLACRAVSTSNITLSGEQTIDGVSVVSGDRVLVAGQTDARRNGIYNASTGAWSRADDANVDNFMVLGSRVSVLEGASAGDWSLTSPTTGSIRIDTTELTFSQHDAPSSTTYTTGPVVMSGRKRMTYSGSATAVIAQASSGHADGSELVIDFPAGSATSLYLSPALNVSGCTINAANQVTDWDPAVKNVLLLARYGNVTIGTLRTTSAPDAVAPTVVSARADSLNADAVTVKFSEPVYVRALTGLSLSFSVGTARTITAIESGDGTTDVTFTLSGSLSSTDVFSFVVGSTRVGTDYSGNLIATSTTSVTMSWGLVARAAWTRCWEKNVAMLPATGLPAALTSWTDQVSGSLQIVQTAGGASASRTSSGLQFASDATERCKAAMVLTSGADFAFYFRAKFTSVGTHDWIPVSFDEDGGASSPYAFVRIVDNGTDTTATVSLNDGATSIDLSDWTYPSDAAAHDFFIWRVGGTLHFQVDAVVAPTGASAQTITGITTIGLGNALVPAAYKPDSGTVIHVATKSGAGFVGTEIADIRTYAAAT